LIFHLYGNLFYSSIGGQTSFPVLSLFEYRQEYVASPGKVTQSLVAYGAASGG
jgi:hypothetical protein